MLEHRNMDILTYLPAMQWLVDRNLLTLRMGSDVETKLPINPGIIDYANLDRSDFLDIYFFANSLFTVSCGSGPDIIPHVLDRPILIINFIPLGGLIFVKSDSVIYSFKQIWSEHEKRTLTFREIFSLRADMFWDNSQYLKAGFVLLPHSSDDILAMVQEMYARFVTKTWIVTDNERKMQQKFRNLVSKFYPGYQTNGLLAYSFYQAHPELLADA